MNVEQKIAQLRADAKQCLEFSELANDAGMDEEAEELVEAAQRYRALSRRILAQGITPLKPPGC